MASQDDNDQGFALGLVFGLVAIVVALVIGVGIYRQQGKAPNAPATPASEATMPATPSDDGASVKVIDGVVKFYFASGKSELAAGANQALAEAIKAAAAGKMLFVSGYHDASGDPAMNAELSKQRAMAVRDAIVAMGVAADKVELKKPEEAQAAGPASEARRVEVVIAP